MGQLRNAYRALAYEHTSPAEMLRRMLRHVDEDEMATAVCLTFDPYTRELAYASAGHPPSLLLDGERRGRLATRRSTRAAARLGPGDAIGEATVELPAGATLVAYTDGLVERRGSSIDDGIDLLASVVGSSSALRGRAPGRPHLRGSRAAHRSTDDIALLLVRLLEVPRRMEIEVPSDPASMVTIRRRLRAWLELRGLAEDECDDTILAVSEACNNAIEHGYPLEPGPLHVLVEHGEGTLVIRVEDRGEWHPISPSFERGRGIPLMRAVMDTAEIEHDGRGTRVLLSRLLA